MEKVVVLPGAPQIKLEPQPEAQNAYDPLAHLNKTGATFLRAMQDPSLRSLRPFRRLALLETSRPLVAFVSEGFRRGQPDADSALPNDRPAAETGLALPQAMADGYGAVAQDLSRQASTREADLALALQRAIRYNSLVLLEHYRRYRREPAGVWKQLHRLYRMAVEHRLQGRAVAEPEGRHSKRVSAADAYKQILLLAAADPYAMRHQEQIKVFAACERLASLGILRPAGGLASSEGLFYLDTDGDLPPKDWRDEELAPHALVLDCTKVCAALKGSENYAGWMDTLAPPEIRNLIMRLERSASSRRRPRVRVAGALKAVVGLSRITRMLADELRWHGDDIAAGKLVRFPAGKSLGAPHGDPTAPRHASAGKVAADAMAGIDCEIVDVSATSYCVRSATAVGADVGEAVALWEAGTSSVPILRIGLVRWVRPDEAGVRLGIELVGVGPVHVRIQTKPRPGQRMSVTSGLLFPRAEVLDQCEKLLAPRLQYPSNERMIIRERADSEEVVLVQELERTQSLQLFKTSKSS